MEMHNFDVIRGGSESKLSWIGKANPASMLNLYHMLQMFGLVRNIWDGNRKNFVCFIKPFLGNIRDSTSYFGVKLDQIHLLQSLKGIMEKLISMIPAIRDLDPPPNTSVIRVSISILILRLLNLGNQRLLFLQYRYNANCQKIKQQ